MTETSPKTLPLEQALELAARRIVASRFTMALTGAGVSTPSGIPDFRATGGIWSRFPVREYGTLAAFCADPEKVWRMFKEVIGNVLEAKPNAAHFALAELESLGRLHALVTQNIDGLHQLAGSRIVEELHGSYRQFLCLTCDAHYTLEEAAGRLDPRSVPRCQCGAALKPAVVLFGEGLPATALSESFSAAHRSDVILVVGTSGQVAPASELPGVVALGGGTLVEFNVTQTELSGAADIRILGDVAVTLPALVAEVKRQLEVRGAL